MQRNDLLDAAQQIALRLQAVVRKAKEQIAMLANFIDNIVAKQQLGQHQRRLERNVQTIRLDGQLLVHLNVVQLIAVATQLHQIVEYVDALFLGLLGVV